MRIYLKLLAAVLAALAASGCVGIAQFPLIEPVSFRPSGTSAGKAIVVDTLTPTFEWKPTVDTTSYDLAIWMCAADGSPGDLVYFKEEITGTSHVAGQVLLPGEYFWSVRKHGSTSWSTTSFKQINPLYASWGRGLPFRIKIAPKMKPNHTPEPTQNPVR